jgi:hypothetical protein
MPLLLLLCRYCFRYSCFLLFCYLLRKLMLFSYFSRISCWLFCYYSRTSCLLSCYLSWDPFFLFYDCSSGSPACYFVIFQGLLLVLLFCQRVPLFLRFCFLRVCFFYVIVRDALNVFVVCLKTPAFP